MAASSSVIVMKVGGSLYDRPDLGSRLRHELARFAGQPILLVPGGGARHESERLGVEALAREIESGDLEVVLVHDGVRPFTEPVVAKDNRKLFRARFAGLERDQAEAICRTLKRADISCITVRN